MSIYSDKLVYIQVVNNYQYSVAQMHTQNTFKECSRIFKTVKIK